MTTKEIQARIFNTATMAGLNPVQAKIIVAQATHESGNFKSNVFKTDNNLFGMKMPTQRSKKYIAGPSKIVMKKEGSTPYASYSSIENSVNDLILGYHVAKKTDWTKIKTPTEYAAYLKSKGYYGDTLSNYTNALQRFFKTITDTITEKPVLPITGAVLLLVAIFFLTSKQS